MCDAIVFVNYYLPLWSITAFCYANPMTGHVKVSTGAIKTHINYATSHVRSLYAFHESKPIGIVLGNIIRTVIRVSPEV